jgi:hypothetical protein
MTVLASAINSLLQVLTAAIPDSFIFNTANTTRIFDALRRLQSELDAKQLSNTLSDPRHEIVRNKLPLLISYLDDRVARFNQDEVSHFDISDVNFLVGYIALSHWADPDNHSDYSNQLPVRELKKDGSFEVSTASGTHCNRFVFVVVREATGYLMTKGEGLLSATSYGIMGAGVFFGNERNKSEAALKYLSNPSDSGDFGNIISFSKDDTIHPTTNNHLGSNHVGIYLGNDLYVSASGSGLPSAPANKDSVLLINVPVHAHYSSVN